MLINDIGLFQTWQFSLYKNILSRLRVSKYRTRDPKKATAFIVPFDLGVNSYIDHINGRPRLAAPLGRLAGKLLRSTCTGKDANVFWKNRGHDHYVFFSITIYQMVGIMVKDFFMDVCQNCTVVTIETSPTKTAIPGRTRWVNLRVIVVLLFSMCLTGYCRKHWYAAPYPSSFHWHEGIKELPWQFNKALESRPMMSLFIGSVSFLGV